MRLGVVGVLAGSVVVDCCGSIWADLIIILALSTETWVRCSKLASLIPSLCFITLDSAVLSVPSPPSTMGPMVDPSRGRIVASLTVA